MALGDQNFANSVIDTTLDEIRGQEAQAQDVIFKGRIDIVGSVFKLQKNYIYGPIQFEQPFSIRPNITFGQSTEAVAVEGNSALQSFKPFLVLPYVYKFKFTNSSIDGFWLGLYAVTDVTTLPSRHVIDWVAAGSASTYSDNQGVDENWTSSYDENESDFLVDDTTADSNDVF